MFIDLGQEFFRWEIATAVAGSIIGINAFNQPDVEASKIETRKLTDRIRKKRIASAGISALRGRRHQAFHRREKCRRAEAGCAGKDPTLVAYLRAHLDRLRSRAIILLCSAFIEMNDAHESAASIHPPRRARQEACRHVSWLRPEVSAFHGPGVQGRAEFRRLPANHLRRRRGSSRAADRNIPSAS